jgi:hypothetical protein
MKDLTARLLNGGIDVAFDLARPLISTLCVWPDGTWCYIEAVDCYTWKSDDYARVTFDELCISPDEASDRYISNLRYV